MDFVLMVGYKKRNMKCVMDPPHFRKTVLIHDGGENFDDCEGSFLFGDELGVDNRAFEVSGF